MKIVLKNSKKINVFVSLCNLLKKSNSMLKMVFAEDHLYIQGMDRSNVCLYDIKLYSTWFDSYELNNIGIQEIVTVDLNSFYLVLSLFKEGNELVLNCNEEEDENLHISFEKDESNKKFTISLINYESDFMTIPESLYNIEIKLKAKKICDLTNQLLLFGEDLKIECFEDKICFNTSGDKGSMSSHILYDDLLDYNLDLEDDIESSYSLNLLNKLCLTTNLTEDIKIYLSDKYPMKFKYILFEDCDLKKTGQYDENNTDDNKSYIEFYIAPKVMDND
jgi:proliferating cell nuclear antigen PCNA